VRETFDERFERAWRLYLAGSIAAFRTGTLELYQVLFARRRGGGIPWTREHLYRRG
jgi:cyclopropane-fatty-acyl-phospholipid synthase